MKPLASPTLVDEQLLSLARKDAQHCFGASVARSSDLAALRHYADCRNPNVVKESIAGREKYRDGMIALAARLETQKGIR